MDNTTNDIFTSSQRIITLPEQVAALFKLEQHISLPANTTFIQPGDTLNYCYLIKSGIVVGCEAYPDGAVREGLILFENCLVGEAFLILNEPSPISFKTIFDTELICIRRTVFLQTLAQNSTFNKLVMESLAKKFLSGMDEVRQMASYNVTWRICNLLRIFAEHHGEEIDGKICIAIHLSQQIISQLLCVNRITTVRIIKKLKNLNLIEQTNGYYWIVDMKAFIRYQTENCKPASHN